MANLKELEGLQSDIEKEIDRLWELSSVISSIKRVVEYFGNNGIKTKTIAVKSV